MDWDAVRHPSGPLPAQVYWYRRLGLLAVGAAVLVLAIVLLTAGGGGNQRIGQAPAGSAAARAAASPGASAPPTPTAATPDTSTPAGSTSSSATAPVANTVAQSCDPSRLTLTVHTSADTYPAGIAPTFTATLHTTGPSCAAPGPLGFTVASGADRIWASTDCAPAAGPPTALPAAGAAGASRTWQRIRSLPGCAHVGGDPSVLPGTYRVTASWAGVSSAEAVFHLR
ncbi:MAG TPA: hypothetical protein VGN54_11795 [Mycobacteriales bacterium]|nr:hypothetical protein [Mycobacteriales bacterium]